MTTSQRFERELPDLLADLYVGGMPDYRDDLLRRTEATSQRPAWSFPTRWLPMDLTLLRVPVVPVPWRAIAVALLILALIAAALVVGSQRRVPPPFGPAANGSLISAKNGDLYALDPVTGESHLVLGGPDVDADAGYSPDGQLLAFLRTTDGQQYLTVADLDGAHVRRAFDMPLSASNWAQWAPDSRHLGVVTQVDGRNRFVLASTDGKTAQVADMGELTPVTFQFRPPDGREIIVQALDHGQVGIWLMTADGSNRRKLDVAPSNGQYGWERDLSGSSWSPAGDRLAYNVVARDATRGPDHFRIHVLTIATGQDIVLPEPTVPDIQQAWAAWSPNGSQILFQRFTWEKSWLGLAPADGSSVGRDLGTPMGGEGTQMDQAWSPDGKTILLRFDQDHLVSIDVATGVETPLKWPIDRIPDWQRLAL
jgi:Tol biopolymer transport system component